MGAMVPDDAPALLEAARGGDRRAFDALTKPHRRALVGHCYRMLGSASDAEDATQDALLRAWRHVGTFEGRASLRAWLYRIATRSCLDALEHRAARRLPSLDRDAPASPVAPPAAPVLDPIWIDAMPDAQWCDDDPEGFEGPEASVTRRQSVAFAFLAAIQMLSPGQRAALLLHEVAGWRAAEIAEALGLSVAAVNSSLQRARATLDADAPRWNRRPAAPSPGDADTLARYVRAWSEGDPARLAATLRDDAVLAMPPVPSWFEGRDAVVAFFQSFIVPNGLAGALVAAGEVNGAAAFASYRDDPATPGTSRADALHVISVEDGAVIGVMVFLGPEAVARAGLPETRAVG